MGESGGKSGKQSGGRTVGGPGQHSDKELKALSLNRTEQIRLGVLLEQVSKNERVYDKNHKAAQRTVVLHSLLSAGPGGKRGPAAAGERGGVGCGRRGGAGGAGGSVMGVSLSSRGSCRPTTPMRSHSVSDLYERGGGGGVGGAGMGSLSARNVGNGSGFVDVSPGAVESPEKILSSRPKTSSRGFSRIDPPTPSVTSSVTSSTLLRSQSMDNIAYRPKLNPPKLSPPKISWGGEKQSSGQSQNQGGHGHKTSLGFKPTRVTLSAVTLARCTSAKPLDTRVEDFLQAQAQMNELNPVPQSVKENTERHHMLNCLSRRRISLTLDHSPIVLKTLKRFGINPHAHQVK